METVCRGKNQRKQTRKEVRSSLVFGLGSRKGESGGRVVSEQVTGFECGEEMIDETVCRDPRL